MKSFLNVLFVKMFKFTELGKKSGSIRTKTTFKKLFIKNILPQNIILGMFSKKNPDSTNRSPKTGKNNFI